VRILEIGCGEKPEHDDSTRLDIRELPGINLVQSATDLSNIGDGSYDRVIARDVIEHLGWRVVPATLKEWLRVVAPGGVLEVETPNALELSQQIVAPESEHLRRHKGESDWERFSRTCFGHQDIAENTHACYFTRAWLAELLLAAGAVSVETLNYSLERFRLAAVAP
jgi:predicted SAM-dependent methyltransferase